MKKLPAHLKNKKTSKNADFKRIYRIYRACLREQRKALVLENKTCKKYAALKEKNKATKEELRAAKCACKMAKNYSAMWKRLVKASLKHVLKWGDIHENCKAKKVAKKPAKKKKAKTAKAKVVKLKAAPKKAAKPKAKKVKLKVKKAGTPKLKAAAKPAVKKAAPKKTTKQKTKKAPVKKVQPIIKIAKPIVIKAAPAKKKAAPKPAAKKPATRKAPAKKPGQKDNLKRIEGVGPKIEGLMNAAGITTFNQVARSSVARLQGILDKAGPHYKFADPATWPQQAKFANAGKWDELKKWQAELKGGKRVGG